MISLAIVGAVFFLLGQAFAFQWGYRLGLAMCGYHMEDTTESRPIARKERK